ncbi:MAG: twin-arginine translocase subunit TatC [Fibrobacterota bacterium]
MSEKEYSLSCHLKILRKTLLSCLAIFCIVLVPAFFLAEIIYDVLVLRPLSRTDFPVDIITTTPVSPVLVRLKMSFLGAALISAPLILLRLWQFLAPALYPREKRLACTATILSFFLFVLAALPAYYILPYLIGLLARQAPGHISHMYDIQAYVSFLFQIFLALGILFQMPLVAFLFSRAGFITHKTLIGAGRYALAALFFAAAFLSPPDVLSQFFLAVPLLLLYGISILCAYRRSET